MKSLRLPAWLQAFRGDRRGNIAVITALSILPLCIMIGLAVDFRRMITARSYVQDAADSAVLAAALNYFNNSGLAAGPRLVAAQTAATNALNADLTTPVNHGIILNLLTNLSVNSTTGELVLTASGKTPTAFTQLVGVPTIGFNVQANAAAGGKPVEIAMILDNTASMFQIGSGGTTVRFTAMRQAAESYVNQVFDLGGTNVKVAVVPWATLVNINSEAVSAADASPATVAAVGPMGSGRAQIASAVNHTGVLAEPATPTTALTAARLATLSAPTTWRGCVRSATGEVTVDANGNVTKAITDTPPTGKWPAALLSSTMSIAYKAATAAVPATTKQVTTTVCDATGPGTTTTTVCDQYQTVTLPGAQGRLERRRRPYDHPGIRLAADRHAARPLGVDAKHAEWDRLLQRTQTSQVCVKSHTVTTATTVCTASHTVTSTQAVAAKAAVPASCTYSGTYSADDARYNAFLADGVTCASLGVKACQSDPNDISYINGGGSICTWRPDAFSAGARNYTSDTQAIAGPNLNCPAPILPLSSNRAQVLAKLNEMYPVPTGTLTDVGLLWGLRTLSPNAYWESFFGLSGAQVPAAFNSTSTYKMAILLSDGVNEAPFWMEGYYGCTAGSGTGTASNPSASRSKAGDCWRSPNISAVPRTQAADNTAATNMMLSACSQLRTVYGVDLYYILVDVTDPNALATAQQCAPGTGHAISTSSSNLQSVFNGLVSRSLRLTH